MALRLNIPHFRTSDIVAIANVPQETIDQWVTLGHLSLDTRPHGRETGLYTGNDVLKVCAAAELSRLGIAPSRSAAGLARLIANQCGVWYQQEHLHVWGDADQLSSEAQNRGRFLSVHTDGAERHTWSVVHDLGPDTSDPGRTVIDCFKIAERVFPELIARLA